MVNMVYGLTLSVWNPESVSQFDGLYDVGHCHAADTRQNTTNHGLVLELLAETDSEAYNWTFHSSLFVFDPSNVQKSHYKSLLYITNNTQFFVFISMTFVYK